MNELLLSLGIESWKPVLAALVLPPVPFIVLVLVGARLLLRRRLLGWSLVLLGAAGMWLASTSVGGGTLTQWLLQPPRVLMSTDIADLRKARRTAIVVLGGGARPLAPEYGVATLLPRTVERLRYGLWLARETGLPVAFSGGVGWDHGSGTASSTGPAEAEIAGRIAERDFGRPLRWLESGSRDTRENAVKTVALLQHQGIDQIVLVTHGYHMRRALRNFERAAQAAGWKVAFVTAPMGLGAGRPGVGDWLPSMTGFEATRIAVHEWLGYLGGA